MANERKEKILDEYEDATLKLLMDEYAEADGERLWREFQEAEEKGEVRDVPEELDKKCQKIIKDSFAKKRWRESVRQGLCKTGKVAIIVLAMLTLSSTLVLSVDAIRYPVINFFLQNSDRYTAITMNEENAEVSEATESIHENIAHIIPEGYELTREEITNLGYAYLRYANAAGDKISIDIGSNLGQVYVDTEDAKVTDIDINGLAGLCVEKDGLRVIWLDDTADILYDVYASNLSETDFWKIVYALVT